MRCQAQFSRKFVTMAKLNFSVSKFMYDKIPHILKFDPDRSESVRWVVHRNKIPYQAKNPTFQASPTNPATWATAKEAIETYLRSVSQSDPQKRFDGIGRVFVQSDGIIGFDLDNIEKVKPQYLEDRRKFEEEILKLSTYIERSPSGKGYHVFMLGRMPLTGRRSSQFQSELYSGDRYFTWTGNNINDIYEVTEQQELIDWFLSQLNRHEPHNQSTDAKNLPPDSTEAGRRINLSDEQLFELIRQHDPSEKFFRVFEGKEDNQPGEWSEPYIFLVTTLDEFSGDVAQVERLILNSPFVTESLPDPTGEDRPRKARRTMPYTYAKARAKNNENYHNTQIGRQSAEVIMESMRKRADEIADDLSRDAAALLKAFGIQDRKITRPPGCVGEFVKATERAMYHPFTKFAIPVTLATLAGICGRSYKTADGNGINLNFILAAKSGTGKTQTMKAWERFIGRAILMITTSMNQHPCVNRIISASASSIQGIYEDFMIKPCAVWYMEECSAQLAQMSNPKTTIDHQFRDAYNTLYDASSIDSIFAPPRSVSSRKAGYQPIIAPSISTYWTLPEKKFDIFTGDIQDGFLSRVIPIRHKGEGGLLVSEEDVQLELPDELNQRLVMLLERARHIDEGYNSNPNIARNEVVPVSFALVKDALRQVTLMVEEIKLKALRGQIPENYSAITRVPMNVKRISAILGIVDHPIFPQVTLEHVEWATRYVIGTLVDLMSDMDRGEIGEVASDDYVTVKRAVLELIKKKEFKHGVPKTKLREVIQNRKPFASDPNKSERMTKTFERMEKDGLVFVMKPHTGEKGRPAQLITPTNDDFWKYG
jgi:hypothetical protein